MDIDGIGELLRQTAEAQITPRFRQLAQGEVVEKGPGDLVTVADRAAEAYLAGLLRQAYPEVLVVGEESVFLGTTSLDDLVIAPHAFVIDPIDGTRNFVHGKREHGVILAEMRGGITTRGWIWQPQYGRMITVERGSGQVLCNGKPVVAEVARKRPLGAAGMRRLVGFTGDGALAPIVRSSGAACFDYPHIVEGTIDFMFFTNSHPWDHLVGCLMLTETGGLGRMLSGEDYSAATRGQGLLVARTPAIWESVAGVWTKG